MPEFDPSSVHRATAIFSNPKSSGFDYEASLCMGAEWTEMATASFHLDAGQSKPVQFSVTMPSALGTYPVYFKVSSGDVLIGTFVADEDVVIAPAGPAWETSPVTTVGAALPSWCSTCWMLCSISVTNKSSSPFPCSVAIHSRYFMSPDYEWTDWRELLPKNLSSYRNTVSDYQKALDKYDQLTMLEATLAPGETKVFSGVIQNLISKRTGMPRQWVKFVGPFGEVVAPSYFLMVEYGY